MPADDELLTIYRAEVAAQLGELAESLDQPPGAWDLGALFRLAHNVKGAAQMVGAGAVQVASHALEDLFSALRDAPDEILEGVVELARDGCRVLESAFDGEATEGEIATLRDRIDHRLVDSTPAGASPRRRPDGGARVARADDTLRVTVDKVDRLLALTADMVSARHAIGEHRRGVDALRAAVTQLEHDHPELRELNGWRRLARLQRGLGHDLADFEARQEKLSTELGDAIRELRMVRVDSLRPILSKLVRDTARATDKTVRLSITGSETEIDRGIFEGLRDPLAHLVRNAIDHGLENADGRRAAGKPELGTVRLEAYPEGSSVCLVLADDGRGIDAEVLLAKAVDLGWLSAERAAETPPEEAWELLFEPGFSTAEVVSTISGRGVGLDVVRANIEQLGGSVRIASSSGRGTAVELRLPLTRLTTRVVQARLGDDLVLVPIAEVERGLRVDAAALGSANGYPVVEVEGEPLPVRELAPLLGLPGRDDTAGDDDEARTALVLAHDGERHAFLVDAVDGDLEVTIQGLAWNLRRLPAVSGCAVVHQRVAPILDAGQLIAAAPAAERVEITRGERHRRRRILVSDDSLTTRTLEKNILTSAGYDVTVATHGAEAWSLLQETPFDLVLSDVDMPEMDGIELTRRLRADERFRSLPVILVTSLGSEDDRQRGADAGADAYIVKGAFDQDELLDALARFL